MIIRLKKRLNPIIRKPINRRLINRRPINNKFINKRPISKKFEQLWSQLLKRKSIHRSKKVRKTMRQCTMKLPNTLKQLQRLKNLQFIYNLPQFIMSNRLLLNPCKNMRKPRLTCRLIIFLIFRLSFTLWKSNTNQNTNKS